MKFFLHLKFVYVGQHIEIMVSSNPSARSQFSFHPVLSHIFGGPELVRLFVANIWTTNQVWARCFRRFGVQSITVGQILPWCFLCKKFATMILFWGKSQNLEDPKTMPIAMAPRGLQEWRKEGSPRRRAFQLTHFGLVSHTTLKPVEGNVQSVIRANPSVAVALQSSVRNNANLWL